MLNIEDINNFIKSEEFNTKSDLCELLSKYESDKSRYTEIYNGWHNYSSLYNYLFKEIRNNDINFFEMGIYKGSSVRSFKDYFSNGKIFAGDINSNYFFDDDSINFYLGNQDNPSNIKNLFDSFNIEFDIIIDDGKHEFISNHNMLMNSIHKLKSGGIYIIEDLRFDVVNKFRPILSELKDKLNLSFIELLIIEHPTNKIDNNLIIIQK